MTQGMSFPPSLPSAPASAAVLSFLFSGSATTAVTAASTAIQSPPAFSTFTLTAGAGVSALTCQVRATNDVSTANGSGGSAWTTIANLNLSAPGSASVGITLPYLALQANVTSLTGGSASATLTAGQSSLATSGGTVMSNPSLTGVPAPTPYLVAQFGIPVVLPSSGSMGNNGALTLTTALPAIFPNCWMYLPLNAIFTGSAANIYFTQMSSTTAGVVYNNTLGVGTGGGAPYIPASPTPFVTTGPGAYTQTSSGPKLVSLPILGGSIGANGAIRFKASWLRPNTAGVISNSVFFGTQQVGNINSGSQYWYGIERTVRNMGAVASQVVMVPTSSASSDASVNGNANSFLTVNTAATQNLEFTASLGTPATDYTVLAGATVEILPAS